jgi:hypothetical protein
MSAKHSWSLFLFGLEGQKESTFFNNLEEVKIINSSDLELAETSVSKRFDWV